MNTIEGKSEPFVPMAKELSIGGFDLVQIARDGDWAVFEQSKGGRVVSYELVKIQRHKAETIRGRSYPNREAYPPNEFWGSEAWTVKDRHEAIERMHKLAAGRLPEANLNPKR